MVCLCDVFRAGGAWEHGAAWWACGHVSGVLLLGIGLLRVLRLLRGICLLLRIRIGLRVLGVRGWLGRWWRGLLNKRLASGRGLPHSLGLSRIRVLLPNRSLGRLLLLIGTVLLVRRRACVGGTTTMSTRGSHRATSAIRGKGRGSGSSGHIPTAAASTRISTRAASVLVRCTVLVRGGVGQTRMLAGPLLTLGRELGPLLGHPALILLFTAALFGSEGHFTFVCTIGF